MYQHNRLNTSEGIIDLESSGPCIFICKGPNGVFRGFAGSLMYSPVERRRLMCPREASQALACASISICLIYSYKIILNYL